MYSFLRQHTEAWTKSEWQEVSIGSDKGLVLNRWQAITCNIDETVLTQFTDAYMCHQATMS